MNSLASRHILLIILTVAGVILGIVLFRWESANTFKDLASNPEAYRPLHIARPYLLTFFALLPSITCLYYCLVGILDRYLIRRFLSSFFITITGFIMIWLLLEIQNRPRALNNEAIGGGIVVLYYVAQLPYIFSLMAPFALLLSCLFVLGQLSNHHEVIGMIQTGRGFFRLIFPFTVLGCILSICIGLLNFHWASWSTSFKDGMVDSAKYDTFTSAKNVVYSKPKTGRVWYVNLIPKDAFNGEPLKNITISFISPDNELTGRMNIDEATWDHKSGHWQLFGVEEIAITDNTIPQYSNKIDSLVMKDWTETPNLLTSTSLSPKSLGIVGIKDWLNQNLKLQDAEPSPYQTQLHYRIASPWACLVAILLAAPMGIVFTRRGTFGGIITALALCLLLFFLNEVSVAMGENKIISPMLAAWGTNIAFLIIAIFLIYRRLTGQSIYTGLKRLFSPG